MQSTCAYGIMSLIQIMSPVSWSKTEEYKLMRLNDLQMENLFFLRMITFTSNGESRNSLMKLSLNKISDRVIQRNFSFPTDLLFPVGSLRGPL